MKQYSLNRKKYRQQEQKRTAVYQNITGNEGPSPLMKRYLSAQRSRNLTPNKKEEKN